MDRTNVGKRRGGEKGQRSKMCTKVACTSFEKDGTAEHSDGPENATDFVPLAPVGTGPPSVTTSIALAMTVQKWQQREPKTEEPKESPKWSRSLYWLSQFELRSSLNELQQNLRDEDDTLPKIFQFPRVSVAIR